MVAAKTTKEEGEKERERKREREKEKEREKEEESRGKEDRQLHERRGGDGNDNAAGGTTTAAEGEQSQVPAEIDTHYQMYGKHFWEVEYGNDRCPTCNRRIDEFGFCACGSSSG